MARIVMLTLVFIGANQAFAQQTPEQLALDLFIKDIYKVNFRFTDYDKVRFSGRTEATFTEGWIDYSTCLDNKYSLDSLFAIAKNSNAKDRNTIRLRFDDTLFPRIGSLPILKIYKSTKVRDNILVKIEITKGNNAREVYYLFDSNGNLKDTCDAFYLVN